MERVSTESKTGTTTTITIGMLRCVALHCCPVRYPTVLTHLFTDTTVDHVLGKGMPLRRLHYKGVADRHGQQGKKSCFHHENSTFQ